MGRVFLAVLLPLLVAAAPEASKEGANPVPDCITKSAFAWCSRAVGESERSISERRSIIEHLAKVRGENRKAAQDTLAWLVFSAPQDVRSYVLEALVQQSVISRNEVAQVPKGEQLVEDLQESLKMPPGHTSNTSYSDVDCVPVSDAPGEPGVYCAPAEFEYLEPKDCRLASGNPLTVACNMTRCGGACMVWHLRLEARLHKKRWHAKAFLEPQGDTGECGCCMFEEF